MADSDALCNKLQGERRGENKNDKNEPTTRPLVDQPRNLKTMLRIFDSLRWKYYLHSTTVSHFTSKFSGKDRNLIITFEIEEMFSIFVMSKVNKMSGK